MRVYVQLVVITAVGSLAHLGLHRFRRIDLGEEREAIDHLEPAVFVFDQHGATLDPITTVVVIDAIDHALLDLMNMSAHHAIEPASSRLRNQRAFEV